MTLPREPQALTVKGYDGISLNVWDYGGDGVPLVLAHCTGTLGRIWDPVVARLGDRFRVIAPDTRGQGDSEAPEQRDDYRWDYSGRDLLAIVAELGLPSGLGAVGHSAGGAHVAYAEHIAPGTFGRLMLIDPIIVDPASKHTGERLAALVKRRVNAFDSIEGARERLSAKPPMEHWVPEALDSYFQHAFNVNEDGACTLKCPGTRETWYYELGGASDLFESLDTLRPPTCLVTGEDSYARAWIEAQHERLQDSRVEVVPGTGHFVPQEKPAEIAALITTWFG